MATTGGTTGAATGPGIVEHRLRLPGDPRALPLLNAAVNAFARAAALPAAARDDLNLVLEELVTNTITHGYGAGRQAWITVAMRLADAGLQVTLCDRAAPFDLLAFRPAPVSPTLEGARLGGVGIALVRRLTRGGCYRRVAGRNVLTLHLRAQSG